MKRFLGSEKKALDEKGRLAIPAKYVAVLRDLTPKTPDELGVMISPNRTLKLMPMPLFEKELERASTFDDAIHDERELLEMASAYDHVKMDKQNRIKIAPEIMKYCGLVDRIVISGNINFLRISSQEVWESGMDNRLKQLPEISGRVAERRKKEAAGAPVKQFVINTGGAAGDE